MNRESEAWEKYADIILLPYRKPQRSKRLSLMERAAQFAPFAALSGYEEMVQEEARLTEPEKELSEWETQLLNETFHVIEERMKDGSELRVRVQYFVKDLRKQGGRREITEGTVKEIDPIFGKLVLYGESRADTCTIPFADMVKVEIMEENEGNSS